MLIFPESKDTRCIYIDTENTQAKCINQRRKTQLLTRWEEGALYSYPLSSLSTRHINMGNVNAHKLCVIEYDFMTHTKF
jgi:hypothetical protein